MVISDKNILIVTNAPTFKSKGLLWGYSPYVKELDLWFKKVKEAKIVSPTTYPTEVFLRAFERRDIILKPLPFLDFRGVKRSFNSFLKLPSVFFKLWFLFFQTDHIHLRCPGNIGLIASIVQIFFPWKEKSVKYAGNWDPKADQPYTYKLQKWILSNTFLTRNMQVLVYGEWPGQTSNVMPFFTASFSEREKTEVFEKTFSGPLTFLYVGNLVEGKQPLKAVKLVEAMNGSDVNDRDQEIRAGSSRAHLEIFGNGPEKEKLKTYVKKNKLEGMVLFHGSRPLEELKVAYQKAHFVILSSKSEGWPKALAEGMFFGCIPIATPVSCVPWMLDYGKRGILLSDQANSQGQKANGSKKRSVVSGQWSGDLKKINNLLTDSKLMTTMSEEAKKWSQQYTLEKFEEAIQGILLKDNKKAAHSKNYNTFSDFL